jgi:Uma2 family endonuclease
MSTAIAEPPRRRAVSRLLTAGELADLPDMLDGKAVKYELEEGDLIIMAPPGAQHGRRQAMITRYLMTDAEERGLGIVFSEVGVVLGRRPDTVFGPDAAFVLKASMPVTYTKEGYLATIPKILVEIQSKVDTLPEMRAKRAKYFAAGVKEVWWQHRDGKRITVATVDGERVLDECDELTSSILPGFSVQVGKLFS